MILFKSYDDLKKLNSNNPAYLIIKQLIQQIIKSNTSTTRSYNFEEDGYLVLIEKDDIDRPLELFQPPLKLGQIKWEGVTLMDEFFHAVKISNNQFTLSFIIPNESWITGKLRQSLEAHLDD